MEGKDQSKNWLKENWFKAGSLVVLIISIAGAFYWFEWRPQQIRKKCDKYATEMVGYDLKVNADAPSYSGLTYDWIKESDDYYQNCLREKGLKK